jgi:hypothetical protein
MLAQGEEFGAEGYFLITYAKAIENQTDQSRSVSELIKQYVDPNVSNEELAAFERFSHTVVETYNQLVEAGLQPDSMVLSSELLDAIKSLNPERTPDRYLQP